MNWPLLQNSLLVAGSAAVFSALLGFFSALWLAGLETRWKKFIAALAILSLALPAFLVTNCWLDLLGLTGTWRSWLPLNIFSLGGAIWILTLMNWPISLFFVLASWRRLEQSQLEIDPLLNGNALIKLLLFPTAKTAIIRAALLTFVLALNNFSVPAILQVKVFPAEVWVNFNTMFDYEAALRLCWPMILVPLLVLFFFRERKFFWTTKRNEISAKHFRQQLGMGWFVCGGVCCVFAIFFSAIFPVSKLLLAKATWSDFLPAFEAGKMAISHSALFAAVTAFVIVAVALFSWRWSLDIFLWLTFLVPGVLLGIFLIWVLNRGPFVAFYQSIGIVIFAFALRYLAPGWNIVAHSLRMTDRNLTDAAQLEGANGWQLFRHVQLPQVFPQLCVAWYVTYLFCLWDVETLIIIVPPGSETIALRVFNLLHYGHNSQVNALCVLLLALAILPLAFFFVAADVRRLISNLGIRASSRRLLRVLMLSPILIFSGCSKSTGGNDANTFPIRSKFFSSVQIIGSRGTGAGQFNKPRSLALDRDDDLFVVDTTGSVQKFSPDGRFLLSWQMPQTDLGKPKGMGRDSDGDVIVVEPHYMRVNHFTPDGKMVFQWGIKGTNEGQLMFPRSVAINSRGELFVSEYGLVERVQHFSKNGKMLLDVIGKPGEGAGDFNRAEGIGIDARDRLYVADSCNHRIQIFSPDGKFLRSYGKAGNGLGELSYPYDVRVDANGFQFVCEFGNSRIQIFDANDQPVEILGEVGAAPGQFANPWSIDFDSHGNLYVADALNHRVQKFLRRHGP
jgi:ABC-type Fe3+ transport system permease subunit/DNA-binding beta-propeller fold protein YncE